MNLKRVVLIGDSVRLGFEPTVRELLADEAIVWGPPQIASMHTVDILTHFWSWIVCQQPDVVHLNSGQWDTRRVVRHHDGNVVPIDLYTANLKRIFNLIRVHTKARIIWATTTPAFAAGFESFIRRHGLPGRNYGDIALYNAAALQIARTEGVAVDDLAALVEQVGPGKIMLPDGIHFSAEGHALIGTAVAEAIRAQFQA